MKLHHYTACGLDNVWLESGYRIHQTPYGKAIAVEDVDGLHRLLATTIAQAEGRLSGREFRFLRVQLGLTQAGLGKLLDVSENAVSLWERKDSVPAVYDHWLRMLVTAQFNGNITVRKAVERIHTVDRLVHQRLVVRGSDGGRRVDVETTMNVGRHEAPSPAHPPRHRAAPRKQKTD